MRSALTATGRAPAALATAALALAALALAACGSSVGQPGSAPLAHASGLLSGLGGGQGSFPPDRSVSGVHACSLIAPSAIPSMIGQLGEKATESSDRLVCFYNTLGGPSYILTVFRRSAYEVAKTIAQSEARASLVHLTSVSGPWDEGFAVSSGKGGPVYNVSVAKGGVAVEVEVDSLQSSTDHRADEMVADAAAGF